MYADDIIILGISVSDLQKLFNLCSNVLNSLGFKINWDKSHCLRIGPRFGIECSNIFCESHIIKWVKSSKFLGLSFISSVSFKGDWHEARGNFYKSANSMLSKLGSSP